MSILILSYAVDPHVDAVKASIQAKGKQFVEYCFLQYPLHSQIGLELKNGTFQAFLTLDSKTYNTEEFTAIWYRRPMGFKAASTVRPDVREYIENESKALFNNMACLFPNALLVSDSVQMRLAENKLLQLQTACRLGLQIPHTFMGNDPSLAKQVIGKYEQALLKPVYIAGFDKKLGVLGRIRKLLWNYLYKDDLKKLYHSNFSYAEVVTMYSKRLDTTTDLWNDVVEHIPNCPITLQQYIPKKLELRITVVGKEIFPCAIYSQELETQGAVDWRPDVHLMRHERYDLPDDVKEKCLLFVEALGLQFGCIDMIVTPDDEYVFLEINPNGQWAWIQEKTGMMISDAIADLLIKGSA